MAQKSWHLDRRTFLRGTGVAVALPWLESMGRAADVPKERPKRVCAVYFANGVSLPPEKHEDHEKWHWFPLGEGRDYRFTQTLSPLEPFRDDLSVLGGLSHPKGRKLVGHATGDIFITGGDVRGSQYRNTISLDQYAASIIGRTTRVPSLVLSSNGGVGYKTRTATISYDQAGEAIPAESAPRQVFDRLFASEEGASLAEKRRKLRQDRRVVDLVLEQSKSLRLKLGKNDREKLDEYLGSVQEIEDRIDRTEAWLGRQRPDVDVSDVDLQADQQAPENYLRTMYDLMYLAFQTDTTRAATFLVSQEDGKGVSDKFPQLALGLGGHHGLSHGTGKDKGYERWAQYDQFLAKQFAHFLDRLKTSREGDGNLLDHTVALYGSATSTTHNARNYPLVLAGGSGLGLKHGAYHRFTEHTPCSNLFVTMLDRLGVPVERFADSTGEMSELT